MHFFGCGIRYFTFLNILTLFFTFFLYLFSFLKTKEITMYYLIELLFTITFSAYFSLTIFNIDSDTDQPLNP